MQSAKDWCVVEVEPSVRFVGEASVGRQKCKRGIILTRKVKIVSHAD